MGGEMGNETYIDLLLVSSVLSPPNFILIEKDNFYTNLVSKKLVFLCFRGYLGEIESEKQNARIFHVPFFSHNQWCVKVSASNFCSPSCSGSEIRL